MSFEPKEKEQILEDITSNILDKLPDLNLSDGEPLKTIIEAIVEEIDLQYWQLGQIYENSFLESSYGDDLTNLVKILGIERIQPQYSTGKVKFYRETPATLDYTIPVGTLVETLPNSDGEIISFETTDNVIMATGQTEVYANVKATEPGELSNVIANKIIIINNPPLGIESVINPEPTIGGEDEESDENLIVRAQNALEASGHGTIIAIESNLSTVSGIKSVKVLDMARGIGTMDILVLGDISPLPSSKIEELNVVMETLKAGGIDFRIVEPQTTIVNVNVKLTLSKNVLLDDVLSTVEQVIDEYFKSLSIGDSLIKNQLSKAILNSSNGIIDITINSPVNNVEPGENNIIVLGTKTIS